MVGPSKILTVSYGTFSCTLEGFDDPFNTMKAIAEYFRDLAADDRYFGAEPPTPDAAMLHRIAEREIQRRVEARVQDNGVILRADAGSAPTAAPVARAPMPAADPVPVARVTMPAAVPVEITAPAPDLRPASAALSDSVAAKLQRLRAAAARSPAPLAAGEPDAPAANGWDSAATLDAAFDRPFAPRDLPPATQDATAAAPAPAAKAAPDAPLPTPETQAPAPQAQEEDDTLLAAPEATGAADSDDESLPAPVAEAADEVLPTIADAPVQDDTVLTAATAPEAEDDTILTTVMAPEAEDDTILTTVTAPEAEDDTILTTATAPEAEDEILPTITEAPAQDDAILAAVAEASATDDEPLPAPVAEAPAPQAQEDDDTLLAAPEAEDEILPTITEAPAQDDAILAAVAEASATDDEPLPVPAAEAPAPQAQEDDDTLLAAPEAEDDILPTITEAPAQDDAIFAPIAAAPATDDEQLPAPAAEPAAAQAPDLPAAIALTDDDLPEAAPRQDAAEDLPEAAAATGPEALPEDEPPSAAASAAVLDKIQRARARVIKIRRADLDALVTPAPAAPAAATLTPEAEADLARELAQLEAETAARATPRPARPDLPAPATDDSVRRLLDQTNSQMEGPENRRRLSAIAHLKAAVAATVADRRAKGAPDPRAEEQRFDPYRNDLERVVRPRRPDQPPEPGQGPRPAPLVLVSEQRIDRPRPAGGAPAAPQGATPPATVVPVRPRRVGGSAQLALTPDTDEDDEDEDENLFVPARGFAEFAEKLGAQTLPDLLEAAAAYAACVEGRPHVSRPQMMRQVAALRPEADQNRETLLRSFGTLLREGRIEKVRRGQFALSDSSRYLEEGRRLTR